MTGAAQFRLPLQRRLSDPAAVAVGAAVRNTGLVDLLRVLFEHVASTSVLDRADTGQWPMGSCHQQIFRSCPVEDPTACRYRHDRILIQRCFPMWVFEIERRVDTDVSRNEEVMLAGCHEIGRVARAMAVSQNRIHTGQYRGFAIEARTFGHIANVFRIRAASPARVGPRSNASTPGCIHHLSSAAGRTISAFGKRGASVSSRNSP